MNSNDLKDITNMIYMNKMVDQQEIHRMRKRRKNHKIWLANMRFFYGLQ